MCGQTIFASLKNSKTMRYFTISILSLLFFAPTLSTAQSLEDAVRYSQLEVLGTARTVGIGGGIGALGADFAALSTNPAGLAAFRRSEFSFTPVFGSLENESLLEGNSPAADNRKSFGVSHLGLVFPSKPLSINWTNTAFAFGYNRLANFHQKAYFEGTSPGSITDRWVSLAQGIPSSSDFFGLGETEAGMALEAEAIYNPDENDDTFYQSDFLPGEDVFKSQSIRRKGSYNELLIAYAGNYKDKIMVGATVGVPIVSYEENKTYSESDPNDANPVFNELEYRQKLETSGVGINLKLGMVVRVNQMLRLGAAVHTPTGIGLKDTSSKELDYSFVIDGTTFAGASAPPEELPEYRLRTPWRLVGSAGLIFGRSGFLTAEVEYLDYANAKFSSVQATGGDENEVTLNERIGSELGSALNLRLGGEFALDKFRFRGGYAIMQSPYTEGFDPTGALSLGAGAWLTEGIFMDLAYRRQQSVGTPYSPYLLNGAPGQSVVQDDTRNLFLMTFGFKF
jgi:hypothetical protein